MAEPEEYFADQVAIDAPAGSKVEYQKTSRHRNCFIPFATTLSLLYYDHAQ